MFEEYKDKLNKVNSQRKLWLYFSSIITVLVILLISFWNWLDSFHNYWIWWAVGSVMLILTVNWWYWTMSIIRHILNYQFDMINSLTDITKDLRSVKKDIQKIAKQTVDKSK